MALAREYKREPDFMAAWEPRIGHEAAHLRYKYERSGFWYPFAGLAGVVLFILGVGIENWIVFLLGLLAFPFMVYLIIINWKQGKAAQRAAAVHFGWPPNRKPGVPIMRIKIFDHWLALHNKALEEGVN